MIRKLYPNRSSCELTRGPSYIILSPNMTEGCPIYSPHQLLYKYNLRRCRSVDIQPHGDFRYTFRVQLRDNREPSTLVMFCWYICVRGHIFHVSLRQMVKIVYRSCVQNTTRSSNPNVAALTPIFKRLNLTAYGKCS